MKSIGHLEGKLLGIHNQVFVPFSCTPTRFLCDVQIIAGCLSEEEIKGLKEMFKNMDSDNSGTITVEELKEGLTKQGTKLSEDEVKQLLEAVSGKYICYLIGQKCIHKEGI